MSQQDLLKSIFSHAEQAKDSLFSQTKIRPEYAIVLGSGIEIFEDLEAMEVVPFASIEGFPKASVKGHKGEVTLGYYEGKAIAIFRGRLHRYEGHPWRDVVFPMTLMHAMGVKKIVMTNSAGGLHYYLTPGDLVLIRDHIYFYPPDAEERSALYQQAGPRQLFSYAPEMIAAATEAAKAAEVNLLHGTYLGLLGPTYETPQEILMFRDIQATVVGMSTVPEAHWANALGMEVMGISCVTNVTHEVAALASTSHEEVVEVAQEASLRLERLLKSLLPRI